MDSQWTMNYLTIMSLTIRRPSAQRARLGSVNRLALVAGAHLAACSSAAGGSPQKSLGVDGLYTVRIEAPCTIHVKSTGDDSSDGRSLSAAFRTPARAIEEAEPGDVVCFAAGSYRGIEVNGVKAHAAAPLVLRTVPGDERRAAFGSGSVHYGTGSRLQVDTATL